MRATILTVVAATLLVAATITVDARVYNVCTSHHLHPSLVARLLTSTKNRFKLNV
jgi:hypothetical protein